MSDFDLSMMTRTEQAVYRLRNLYGAYGFTPYKMSKFEAYDLYLRNKSFLLSDNIITFTDHGGKLMALKPDVTLSIVKNADETPGRVSKVYYNEQVYRVPKGEQSFREIMQVGIECVGDVTAYNVSEVVCLAAKSLAALTDDYALDISHLGIVSAFLDRMGAEGKTREDILTCIGEKNLHGVKAAGSAAGLDATLTDDLCRLVGTYGDVATVLPRLADMVQAADGCGLDELNTLSDTVAAVQTAVPGARIYVDFSVIHNMKYYNGIVFRGFVKGIAAGVLSGGQYDRLLGRMGKDARAVGFAVYFDRLEDLDDSRPAYDVDTVLLYDVTTTAPSVVAAAVEARIALGEHVLAACTLPENMTYRQIIRLDEKGGESDEIHV